MTKFSISIKRSKARLSLWMILIFMASLSFYNTSCKKDDLTEPPIDTTPVNVASINLIPAPVYIDTTGKFFRFTNKAAIYVNGNDQGVNEVAQYLAEKLNKSTGYNTLVKTTSSEPGSGNIYLSLKTIDSIGDEGYQLRISEQLVTLFANKAEGLFRGIQTLRQLFLPDIEKGVVAEGPWGIPTATITDFPRFSWRGAMLDVSRHFFGVDDVKRYIDLLSYYKINRFHLHLSDDQGWRITIDSWPNLTTIGGSKQVGGGAGGYFSKAQYSEIVAYAQKRYIMVIPEIDMPGHTNAALASYAELNCDGKARNLYTGTDVGFSSLCLDKENTYQFIDDVVKELAALTPGPYIHIGGDEALTLQDPEYIAFINKVQTIVEKHGKKMIGWEEVAKADFHSSSVAQHWNSSLAKTAAQKGGKVIMSPASRAYIDMKYSGATTLGHNWAGYIEVNTGYSWDPATWLSGLPEASILGIEAPLWTEFITKMRDIEYMAFPRMLGYAEMGWSKKGRKWDEYKNRLAAHGPRMTAMGIYFYKSKLVNWQ